MRVACIIFTLLVVACNLLLGCANDYIESDGIRINYKADIDRKIEKINLIYKQNDIADAFFFITDLHWEVNDKKSHILTQYIMSHTKVDTIIFGGDYISDFYEDKDIALSFMTDCIDAYTSHEYYAILGNHETNSYGIDTTPPVSAEESNLVLNKGRFDKSYFCVEDNDNKISKVFLDTNTFSKDDEQYNWLKQKLISLDSDVTAFIFMHIYNDYKLAGEPLTIAPTGKLLNEMLSDIADDMSCSIGGIFSGHTHRDFMETNNLGYTTLSTACDGRGRYDACDDLYERKAGEFSEQAFDVVQIDTTSRKVFLTRIGAGYDREYTY